MEVVKLATLKYLSFPGCVNMSKKSKINFCCLKNSNLCINIILFSAIN